MKWLLLMIAIYYFLEDKLVYAIGWAVIFLLICCASKNEKEEE